MTTMPPSQSLEGMLRQREEELAALQNKFYLMRDDFNYNLKLVEERDAELARYESSTDSLKAALAARDAQLQEMRTSLSQIEATAVHEKAREAGIQTEMVHLQQQLEASRYQREDDLRHAKEQWEDERREMQRQLQEKEREAEHQRAELVATYDGMLRQREMEHSAHSQEVAQRLVGSEGHVRDLERAAERAAEAEMRARTDAQEAIRKLRDAEARLPAVEAEVEMARRRHADELQEQERRAGEVAAAQRRLVADYESKCGELVGSLKAVEAAMEAQRLEHERKIVAAQADARAEGERALADLRREHETASEAAARVHAAALQQHLADAASEAAAKQAALREEMNATLEGSRRDGAAELSRSLAEAAARERSLEEQLAAASRLLEERGAAREEAEARLRAESLQREEALKEAAAAAAQAQADAHAQREELLRAEARRAAEAGDERVADAERAAETREAELRSEFEKEARRFQETVVRTKEAFQAQLAERDTQLASLSAKSSDLASRLHDREARAGALEERAEIAEKEAAQASMAREAAEAEAEAERGEYRRVSAELRSARSELASAQEELARLSRDLGAEKSALEGALRRKGEELEHVVGGPEDRRVMREAIEGHRHEVEGLEAELLAAREEGEGERRLRRHAEEDRHRLEVEVLELRRRAAVAPTVARLAHAYVRAASKGAVVVPGAAAVRGSAEMHAAVKAAVRRAFHLADGAGGGGGGDSGPPEDVAAGDIEVMEAEARRLRSLTRDASRAGSGKGSPGITGGGWGEMEGEDSEDGAAGSKAAAGAVSPEHHSLLQSRWRESVRAAQLQDLRRRHSELQEKVAEQAATEAGHASRARDEAQARAAAEAEALAARVALGSLRGAAGGGHPPPSAGEPTPSRAYPPAAPAAPAAAQEAHTGGAAHAAIELERLEELERKVVALSRAGHGAPGHADGIERLESRVAELRRRGVLPPGPEEARLSLLERRVGEMASESRAASPAPAEAWGRAVIPPPLVALGSTSWDARSETSLPADHPRLRGELPPPAAHPPPRDLGTPSVPYHGAPSPSSWAPTPLSRAEGLEEGGSGGDEMRHLRARLAEAKSALAGGGGAAAELSLARLSNAQSRVDRAVSIKKRAGSSIKKRTASSIRASRPPRSDGSGASARLRGLGGTRTQREELEAERARMRAGLVSPGSAATPSSSRAARRGR